MKLLESHRTQHHFNTVLENYLKAIWNVSEGNTQSCVSNSEISTCLNISRASVSDMMKKLSKDRWVRPSQKRGSFQLTSKGKKKCLEVLRKHRVVELFLSQELGLSGLELHHEAEYLEHALSPFLTEKLFDKLKAPKTDAFGMRIPNPEEFARHCEFSPQAIRLSEINENQEYVVHAIPDYSEEVWVDALNLGFCIHQKIRMHSVLNSGTLVLLNVENSSKFNVTFRIANQVRVLAANSSGGCNA